MNESSLPHNSASNNAVSREIAWLARILDPNGYPEGSRQEVQEFASDVLTLRAQGGELWADLRSQLVRAFGGPSPEPVTLQEENYIRQQLGEPLAMDLGGGMSETRYAAMLKGLDAPTLLSWHTTAKYLAWAYRLDPTRQAQEQAKVRLISGALVTLGVTPPHSTWQTEAPKASRRAAA